MPMQATLYVSRFCFLCAVLKPALQRWFSRRGYALAVVRVRGKDAPVPAVPALVLGPVTLVGAGILSVLARAERG